MRNTTAASAASGSPPSGAGGHQAHHDDHGHRRQLRHLAAPARSHDHLRLRRAAVDHERARHGRGEVGAAERQQVGVGVDLLVEPGRVGPRGRRALGEDHHDHRRGDGQRGGQVARGERGQGEAGQARGHRAEHRDAEPGEPEQRRWRRSPRPPRAAPPGPAGRAPGPPARPRRPRRRPSTVGRCARGSSASTRRSCSRRVAASRRRPPGGRASWPSATATPTPVRKPTSTVRDRKFARNPRPTTRAEHEQPGDEQRHRARQRDVARRARRREPGQARSEERRGRGVRRDDEVARGAQQREHHHRREHRVEPRDHGHPRDPRVSEHLRNGQRGKGRPGQRLGQQACARQGRTPRSPSARRKGGAFDHQPRPVTWV